MKNINFHFLAFLFISLGLLSCGKEETPEMEPNPDPDPIEVDFTIYPGQGLGTLKIGDRGSEVKEKLGEGFERIVNVGGSGNATYNYFNDPKGIDIIFGQYGSGDLDVDTMPIRSFYVFDDFDGETEEGIKIGSTKAEVVATFGEPDQMDMWNNVTYPGLLISYNDMNVVRSIAILEE